MKLFILILFTFSLKAQAEAFEPFFGSEKAKWDSANHPEILVSKPNYHFPSLPLAASLRDESTLWSDSYWPRNEGGIARRWQDLSGKFTYKILTEKEARALTPEEISKLSPAEKFDLLQNDYSFSFTKKVKGQNPLNRPSWEGICDGWAQASVLHSRFLARTLKNKAGKDIFFASSDIAAIMSYFYAKVGKGRVSFLGRRCREEAGSTSIKCTDMNAGAFHIVLTNRLAEKRSFILDLDPNKSVWNYPVLGYQTTILEEHAPSPQSAAGTVRELLVSTKLFFVQNTGPEWNPPARVEGVKTYWYWLELDKNDNIIGGTWDNTDHPDFAWMSAPIKIPSPYSVFAAESLPL